MGEVDRARDSRLAHEVAIKALRADAVQSGDQRHRFETEARAASALNHPNILTCAPQEHHPSFTNRHITSRNIHGTATPTR